MRRSEALLLRVVHHGHQSQRRVSCKCKKKTRSIVHRIVRIGLQVLSTQVPAGLSAHLTSPNHPATQPGYGNIKKKRKEAQKGCCQLRDSNPCHFRDEKPLIEIDLRNHSDERKLTLESHAITTRPN
jgi:hypothetical protein